MVARSTIRVPYSEAPRGWKVSGVNIHLPHRLSLMMVAIQVMPSVAPLKPFLLLPVVLLMLFILLPVVLLTLFILLAVMLLVTAVAVAIVCKFNLRRYAAPLRWLGPKESRQHQDQEQR